MSNQEKKLWKTTLGSLQGAIILKVQEKRCPSGKDLIQALEKSKTDWHSQYDARKKQSTVKAVMMTEIVETMQKKCNRISINTSIKGSNDHDVSILNNRYKRQA